VTTAAIELFSGIGNIIQQIPFLQEIRKRYDIVNGYTKDLAFKQSLDLVKPLLDEILEPVEAMNRADAIFAHPKRESYPEYLAWFRSNKITPPDTIEIQNIPYSPRAEKHRIVIWPECQKNWPGKMWPYWKYLIEELTKKYSVAVVGLYPIGHYGSITDYRGKLSLLETGGIIKNADIFIGNEGGISHYSSALRTNTFIIYGCSDPVKNNPPQNATMISKNLKCQPCQFSKDFMRSANIMIGCIERKCLVDLMPEEVIKRLPL